MELRGTRALVVGATGGIGGAVARALVEAGAQLVVAGRDPARLAAVAAATGARAVAADLSEPTAADQAIGEAVAMLGGLDLVVCCVGGVAFGPVSELDDAAMTAVFAANVFGPIRLARAAVPALAPGGVMATISGVVADHPTAGMAAYSATKAAITAFDRALAQEVRRSGVRVLDVRPPRTETGLAERPLAGVAPKLAPGRDADAVAAAILDALVRDADEVAF
jgi:NAD(P)-dependent dehydrogenase (short-subunit alcohol dehydrogenase family)